ncbi:50S ribosomal protein L4 [Myxococcota bacterium]
MPTMDVLNQAGEKVGELVLADEVFAAEVKEHLLHEVVTAQLASRRGGTRGTKERSAVRGSKKKIYRQKGTGRARHGSVRAPTFVGGGRAHPVRPQDWSYRPPRQVRIGALRSALSLLVRQGRMTVLEHIELDEIKTCKLVGVLDTLKVANKALVVDTKENSRLRLSIRNLEHKQYLPPEGVNVYDLLRHDHLVVSCQAAKALEARCLGGHS